MRVLRWALLLPAAIGVWYAVFFVGLFGHFFIERHFCPPEDLVSGFCTNESIQQVLDVLMHLSVAASAIAVVLVATAMAPSYKEFTVWATLAAGIVVSGIIGFSAHAWLLFLAAVLGGVLGATVIVIFLRVQAANHSLQARRP